MRTRLLCRCRNRSPGMGELPGLVWVSLQIGRMRTFYHGMRICAMCHTGHAPASYSEPHPQRKPPAEAVAKSLEAGGLQHHEAQNFRVRQTETCGCRNKRVERGMHRLRSMGNGSRARLSVQSPTRKCVSLESLATQKSCENAMTTYIEPDDATDITGELAYDHVKSVVTRYWYRTF